MKLKSIEEEANDCRKAFAQSEGADYAVHGHPEELYEKLYENPEDRILYILKEKPVNEQALRLRLFRPVTGTAWAEYEKVEGPAHKLICSEPDCPWDGNSIFKTQRERRRC